MSTAAEGEILTTELAGSPGLLNLKPEALRGIIKKEVRKESELERETNS